MKHKLKKQAEQFMKCGLTGWGLECFWTGLGSICFEKNKKMECAT